MRRGRVRGDAASSVVHVVTTDHTGRRSPRLGGTETEFDRCFRQNYERVARTSALAVGDSDLGREIAQEAFVRLYERWGRMRSEEHARRFAYRVAFNLSRSYIRRNRRLSMGDEVTKGSPGANQDPTDSVVDRLTVLDVVRSLSPRQRACLLMVDFAGFDPKETARTLRIRPATVHVHLSRARRALRVALSATD